MTTTVKRKYVRKAKAGSGRRKFSSVKKRIEIKTDAVFATDVELSEKNKRKPKEILINGKEVTLNGYFKVELGTYSILNHNIDFRQNTLLIGPSGLGKTELAWNLAKIKKVPIHIFDMGTMTDPIMGLVGTHVIEVIDGKTYSSFRKSRFSDVIQNPGIVLLDEINRAATAANNILFPCLDFRRELPMEYSFSDTTPISIHSDCVFFATANIGSQYTGTHKLDKALVDRFMIIAVDSLSKEQIIESLHFTNKKLSNASIETIVNIYLKINKEHDDFKISFNLSFRHLKTVANMTERGFTIYDGYYSICKGLGGAEGLKSIESVLNPHKK